jgi:hypothetical protein
MCFFFSLIPFIDEGYGGEINTAMQAFRSYQKELEEAMGRKISPEDNVISADLTAMLFALAHMLKKCETAEKDSPGFTPEEKMAQRLDTSVARHKFKRLHAAASKFCLTEPEGHYFKDIVREKEQLIRDRQETPEDRKEMPEDPVSAEWRRKKQSGRQAQ